MIKEVKIVAYTADWQTQYEIEKQSICDALNSNFIDIEHIGSTSVINLGAKPIIDMMIGVTSLEDADLFIAPLSNLGYEHIVHAQFPNRRFFRKGAWGAGTHHLHIYVYESEEWCNQLLFRDYLRKNEDAKQAYFLLKQNLATTFANNRTAYTEAKADFILQILKKAKKVSD